MSAVGQSAERVRGGSIRLRIALVRAIVDEVERSLREFDRAQLSSVGQQLAEELGQLARAFRQPAVTEDPMVDVCDAATSRPILTDASRTMKTTSDGSAPRHPERLMWG